MHLHQAVHSGSKEPGLPRAVLSAKVTGEKNGENCTITNLNTNTTEQYESISTTVMFCAKQKSSQYQVVAQASFPSILSEERIGKGDKAQILSKYKGWRG